MFLNYSSLLLLLMVTFLLAYMSMTTHARSITIEVPESALGAHETPEQRFTRSDADDNNKLSLDEFLHIDLPYFIAKRNEFEQLDHNGNGFVEKSEYISKMQADQEQVDKRRAHYFGKIFEDFDDNFDMKLESDELRKILEQRFSLRPRDNFGAIFERFDTNHDGGLNLREYIKFDSNVPFEDMDAISGRRNNKQRPEKMKKTEDSVIF